MSDENPEAGGVPARSEFADLLAKASDEHRAGRLAADPLLPLVAVVIESASRSAAWVAQLHPGGVRVLASWSCRLPDSLPAWLLAHGFKPLRCAVHLRGPGRAELEAVGFEVQELGEVEGGVAALLDAARQLLAVAWLNGAGVSHGWAALEAFTGAAEDGLPVLVEALGQLGLLAERARAADPWNSDIDYTKADFGTGIQF